MCGMRVTFVTCMLLAGRLFYVSGHLAKEEGGGEKVGNYPELLTL